MEFYNKYAFSVAVIQMIKSITAWNNAHLLAHSSVGQKSGVMFLGSAQGVTKLKSRFQLSEVSSWGSGEQSTGIVPGWIQLFADDPPISLMAVRQGLLQAQRGHLPSWPCVPFHLQSSGVASNLWLPFCNQWEELSASRSHVDRTPPLPHLLILRLTD